MTDLDRALLAETLRTAIDELLDNGCTQDEIREELAYQLENYDWDAA